MVEKKISRMAVLMIAQKYMAHTRNEYAP